MTADDRFEQATKLGLYLIEWEDEGWPSLDECVADATARIAEATVAKAARELRALAVAADDVIADWLDDLPYSYEIRGGRAAFVGRLADRAVLTSSPVQRIPDDAVERLRAYAERDWTRAFHSLDEMVTAFVDDHAFATTMSTLRTLADRPGGVVTIASGLGSKRISLDEVTALLKADDRLEMS